MGKPKSKSVIASFSHSVDDLPVIEELEKIAEREQRSVSFVTLEAIKAYVKSHKEGNYQFTLEKSSIQEFKAFPTIGEPLMREKLEAMEEQDFLELATTLRARVQEVNGLIRARGYMWKWNL